MLFSERHSQNGHVNLYITLVWVRGVCVILNNEVWGFKFSIVDNEFYLFLRFDGFNVFVYNIGYYLLV